MAVVPYTFANQAGQIPLSELDVNFANVKAFAETAGNVTNNVQANITAVGTLVTLSVTGNIVAARLIGNVTGNVTGNVVGNVIGNVVGNVIGNISGNLTVSGSNTQVLFNDNGLANAVAGMTFNKNLNALVVNGNVTGGNIVTTGSTTATGNVTGGNISTAGSLTATGNISTAGSILAAGNITGGNVLAPNAVIATLLTGGNLQVTGSVSGSTMTAVGNITGGNIITAGAVSLSGNLSAGGNTVLSGNATAVTAANGTSTTQIATTAFVANSLVNGIPSGVITLWSGSIAGIPAGWALCNGASGTPDLRNRFIVGAGSTYAVNAVGGSANAIVVDHTHSATSVVSDPGHAHSYTAPSGTDSSGIGGSVVDTTVAATTGTAVTGITVATTVASAGVSGINANLPPYYALAYIMKL